MTDITFSIMNLAHTAKWLPRRVREYDAAMAHLAQATARRALRPLKPTERCCGLPAAHLPDDILAASILTADTPIRWIGGAPQDAQGLLIDPLPAGTLVAVHHRPRGADAGWVVLTYPEGTLIVDWSAHVGDYSASRCADFAARQLQAAWEADWGLRERHGDVADAALAAALEQFDPEGGAK